MSPDWLWTFVAGMWTANALRDLSQYLNSRRDKKTN